MKPRCYCQVSKLVILSPTIFLSWAFKRDLFQARNSIKTNWKRTEYLFIFTSFCRRKFLLPFTMPYLQSFCKLITFSRGNVKTTKRITLRFETQVKNLERQYTQVTKHNLCVQTEIRTTRINVSLAMQLLNYAILNQWSWKADQAADISFFPGLYVHLHSGGPDSIFFPCPWPHWQQRGKMCTFFLYLLFNLGEWLVSSTIEAVSFLCRNGRNI